MAHLGKVRALVFSRRNVGEADRLVTFFTERYGLLKVLAKGVRKVPSRRGGHLEPLTCVLGVVSGASGRYYLSAVETLEYYFRLQGDRAAREQAGVMAEMVTYFLGEEEPAPELYKHLHHLWLTLPLVTNIQRWLLEMAFAYSLLRRAGVAPQIHECVECHTQQPREAIVLDGNAGGWRCLSCHHHFTAAARYSLTPASLRVLQFLARSPHQVTRITIAPEQAWQLTQAVRHYVAAAAGQSLPSATTWQPSLAIPYGQG